MEFNKFMLMDYMQTPEGERVFAFFEHFKDNFEERDERNSFFDFFTKSNFLYDTDIASAAFSEPDVEFDFSDFAHSSIEEFEREIEVEFESEEDAKNALRSVPFLSAQLFCLCPEYAFPYLLPQHFHLLKAVCEILHITLPDIPKSSSVARFGYYSKLCRAIYDFRVAQRLSPIEMCVLAYGYAIRLVDRFILDGNVRPNKVYSVYAGKADILHTLARPIPSDEVLVWQGNEEMIPGDIVLMYELSPHSFYGSVWKAVSPGFDDPFDLYKGKVFISECIRIPPISFSTLQRDEVWKNNGAVRANMLGGSGRANTFVEYEALKRLISTVDPAFDIRLLPATPAGLLIGNEELRVEHDVEVRLLEPFLRELGFGEGDWVTQYSVRIGRENSSRPDYVVHLRNRDQPDVTADYVFEAKLTVPHKRQLKKDFGQTVRYARLLNSLVACLVSREGIWFARREDNFVLDGATHYRWDELKT